MRMFATVCLYLRMCVSAWLRACEYLLTCMHVCVNVRDNVHACSCGAYVFVWRICANVCVCASVHACVLMHVIVSIMLVSMSLQMSSIN